MSLNKRSPYLRQGSAVFISKMRVWDIRLLSILVSSMEMAVWSMIFQLQERCLLNSFLRSIDFLRKTRSWQMKLQLRNLWIMHCLIAIAQTSLETNIKTMVSSPKMVLTTSSGAVNKDRIRDIQDFAQIEIEDHVNLAIQIFWASDFQESTNKNSCVEYDF